MKLMERKNSATGLGLRVESERQEVPGRAEERVGGRRWLRVFCALRGLVHLHAVPGRQRRAMKRLARAKRLWSWAVFLARPRQRVLRCRKRFLRM